MKVRFVLIVLVVGVQFISAAISGRALAAVISEHDAASLRRGAVTFVNLCMLCHDMKYLDYASLRELDFPRQQLDTLRHGNSLQSHLRSAMTPEAARKLFGMEVPDLSLMARAREGGAGYVYHLLTAYYKTDAGTIDNRQFPQIRMPDVLGYAVESGSQARGALETQARDVAAFLDWAAEPQAGIRRRLGYFVMGYLVVLTGLLYLVKKKVWRRLR